jgi:hypothetical protein
MVFDEVASTEMTLVPSNPSGAEKGSAASVRLGDSDSSSYQDEAAYYQDVRETGT